MFSKKKKLIINFKNVFVYYIIYDTFFFFGCWNKDHINCCDMKPQISPSSGAAKGSAAKRVAPVAEANAGPAEEEKVDHRKIILDCLHLHFFAKMGTLNLQDFL